MKRLLPRKTNSSGADAYQKFKRKEDSRRRIIENKKRMQEMEARFKASVMEEKPDAGKTENVIQASIAKKQDNSQPATTPKASSQVPVERNGELLQDIHASTKEKNCIEACLESCVIS